MTRKSLTNQEKEARAELLKNETKDERFRRVAEPRLKKALKHIKMVSAMAKGSTYSVLLEDKERIKEAVQTEVDALYNALEGGSNDKEVKDIF